MMDIALAPTESITRWTRRRFFAGRIRIEPGLALPPDDGRLGHQHRAAGRYPGLERRHREARQIRVHDSRSRGFRPGDIPQAGAAWARLRWRHPARHAGRSYPYRGYAGEGYSPLTHFISELGEIAASRLAWAFNLGIVLGGIGLERSFSCLRTGSAADFG